LQRINSKPNEKLTLRQLLGFVALGFFIVAFLQFIPVQTAAADEIDAKTCAECHDELAAAFNNSAHMVIDKKGLVGHAGAKFSCESCHGDLKKHLEEAQAGNIFAFKAKDTASVKANACLACHKDNHADYFAGPHGKAALDCTTCHGIHGKTKQTLLKGGATKVCWSCHEDVFAKFKLNERHRLMEGVLGCESCHDPHKPATRERLAGFKQEACFKCHTDKEGPYLFEHGVVAIEGCTTCHEVHGSPNRHLLVDQSVSQLCYGCHTVVPGWHSRFTPDSNCVSCHATIHGSNHSPKFLK